MPISTLSPATKCSGRRAPASSDRKSVVSGKSVDLGVTGVETCALPIYFVAGESVEIDVQALDADFYAFSGHKVFGPTGTGILRSEERRVGKECRSWGDGS